MTRARQRSLARRVHVDRARAAGITASTAWVDHFLSWRHELRAPRRCRRHRASRCAVGAAADRPQRRARAAAATHGALQAWAHAARCATSAAPTRAARRGARRRRSRALGDRAIADRACGRASATELPVVGRSASARASAPGTRCFRARRRRRAGAHGTFARRARRACRTSRRWASTSCTCRRSIRSAAAAARDRNNALDGRARRVGQPVGDRRGARAATRRSIPSSARSTTSAAWSQGRAHARHRDRARHRVPVRARSSVGASEHPEWFRIAPDGTIQYAENPPKKYQDIYPFDFETDDWRALWQRAEERRSMFWIDQGVRIFRVDNPHTKPFAFWEWVIAEVRARAPGRDLPRPRRSRARR